MGRGGFGRDSPPRLQQSGATFTSCHFPDHHPQTVGDKGERKGKIPKNLKKLGGEVLEGAEMGLARTLFRRRQGHLESGKSKASGKSSLFSGLFQNVWGLVVISRPI